MLFQSYDAGMLLTFAHEDGEDRLYTTRFQSVRTFFTSEEGGDGVIFNAEPGFAAIPSLFHAPVAQVEASVMAEMSARIGKPANEILQMTFAELRRYADPELPNKYRYASRSRGRTGSNRAY